MVASRVAGRAEPYLGDPPAMATQYVLAVPVQIHSRMLPSLPLVAS